MKREGLLLVFGLTFSTLWGQTGSVVPTFDSKNGTLTSTVYDWEAIGINPANLGWSNNHLLSFTVLDAGVSGQSPNMNFSNMMHAMGSSGISGWQHVLAPPGMNANADINWLAVSFRVPKVPGAFAVSMNDKIMGNAILSNGAATILSSTNDKIYNDSITMALLAGTKLHYLHYREINVAYGSPLLNISGPSYDNSPGIAKCFSFDGKSPYGSDRIALYGGIGIKYLIGYASIDGNVSNGINATYAVANNYPNVMPGFGSAPGHGFAADLGLGAEWKRWKFGFSVTDLGYIKWKHTLVTSGDTNVAAITNGSDIVNELKNGTLVGSQPAQEDEVTTMPAKMRIGASFQVNKQLSLSSDLIVPLNNSVDNIASPYIAIGGQDNITGAISLFAGLSYLSATGLELPLGVTINASRHVQFYVGTIDATSYLGRRSNANISGGLWMFRYNL